MAATIGQLSRLTKLQWNQWVQGANAEALVPMTSCQMQLMLGPIAPSLRELVMTGLIKGPQSHDGLLSASANAICACTQLTLLRLGIFPFGRGVF